MHQNTKNRRKQGVIDFTNIETAGKQLGIIAGILTSLGLIWGFVISPIKRVYLRNKARDAAVVELSKSCGALRDSIDTLNKRVGDMQHDFERSNEVSDKIRKNLYHGQIATISALRELAAHEGLKINGPVQLYYEQNIAALRAELNCKPEE